MSCVPSFMTLTDPELTHDGSIRIYSVKLSARTDTTFGDTIVELTQMIHKTAPSKTSSQELKNSKEAPLKVIPSSSSPKQSSKDSSPVTSKPRSVSVSSSSNSASGSDRRLTQGNDGDDAVYTHIEPPEKSGCCTIS